MKYEGTLKKDTNTSYIVCQTVVLIIGLQWTYNFDKISTLARNCSDKTS